MSKRRGKNPRGGGKNKKGNQEEGETEKLKRELERSKQQIETYERFLVLRSEQAQNARKQQELMRERLEQLEKDFQREKEDRLAIATDMVRQYKDMWGRMVEKEKSSVSKLRELSDQLDIAKVSNEKQRDHYEQLLEEKQQEIEKQKQKMDEMVKDFQEMLSDVLEKMGSSVDESNLEQTIPKIKLYRGLDKDFSSSGNRNEN